MSVIAQETRSPMAQKRFTGTFQEFDAYYQQLKAERVTPKTHISVVFEIEEALTPEQQEKKEQLQKSLQETKQSIERGEGVEFTPELAKELRAEARKRYLAAQ